MSALTEFALGLAAGVLRREAKETDELVDGSGRDRSRKGLDAYAQQLRNVADHLLRLGASVPPTASSMPPAPTLAELAYAGAELAHFVEGKRAARKLAEQTQPKAAALLRHSPEELDALERAARWICMHAIGPDAWIDAHEANGLTLREYTPDLRDGGRRRTCPACSYLVIEPVAIVAHKRMHEVERATVERVLRLVAGHNEAGAAIAEVVLARYVLDQVSRMETPT